MAVLVEAFSVVVKDETIENKFRGGFDAFMDLIPNSTYSTDDELHCVSFLKTEDMEDYVNMLISQGLVYVENNEFVDIAIVDMLRGPLMKCNWLGFSRSKYFSNLTQFKNCNEDFSITWLLPEIGVYGIPVNEDKSFQIAVHPDWNPDNALYTRNFLSQEEIERNNNS